MPVPGLSLLGLKRIRGFVSILRYINPTIIIIIITTITLGNQLAFMHEDFDRVLVHHGQEGPATDL